MVGDEGSSASTYLADPTSLIPSHYAVIIPVLKVSQLASACEPAKIFVISLQTGEGWMALAWKISLIFCICVG